MKLPKQSTVCTICDEITNIKNNEPIITNVVYRKYNGLWIIHNLHIEDCCKICHRDHGPILGNIDFLAWPVRFDKRLNFYSLKTFQMLQIWILENHGQPQ